MKRRVVKGHPGVICLSDLSSLQTYFLQRMFHLLFVSALCGEIPLVETAKFVTWMDLRETGLTADDLWWVSSSSNLPPDEGSKQLAQAVREEMGKGDDLGSESVPDLRGREIPGGGRSPETGSLRDVQGDEGEYLNPSVP